MICVRKAVFFFVLLKSVLVFATLSVRIFGKYDFKRDSDWAERSG